MPNTSDFFPEVNDSIMEGIPVSNVKASPSINSANDGSFNSEENLKWANKKLTQKPFIVGATSEEVRKSFSLVQNDGESIRISPGMLSADGYLFKISDTENISYDQDPSENFSLDVTTKYMTKFVRGLTNQTTAYAVDTNLNDFVYSEYRTTEEQDTYQKNWFTASATDGTVVGYIVNRYSGEYFNSLEIGDTTDIEVPDYVIFSKNAIVIANSNNSHIMDGVSFNSIDDIKNFHENEFFKIGDPFALYTDGNDYIEIYYPVKLVYRNIFNEQTSKYEKTMLLAYTNIFGLLNYYDTPVIESRTYPNTFSIWVTVDTNDPLSSVTSNSILKTVWNSTFYNADSLYHDSFWRYTKQDFEDGSASSLNINTETVTYSFLSDIFDVVTDEKNYIPEADETIQYHEGILIYYCIPDIPDAWKQTIIKGGETKYVPICFMTSDGSLCTQGFVHGENNDQIISTYPVEGYLHCIKRLYCEYKLGITPTEADIQAVTVKQLTRWTSSSSGPNFTAFYEILQKYIGFYMQLCYSSLINNVLNTNKYKFNGCGDILPSSSPFTKDEFYTYQEYTRSNGAIVKNGTGYSYASVTTTIPYQNDISNDYLRISDRVDCLDNGNILVPGEIAEDNTENIRSSLYDFYTSPVTTISGVDVTFLGIEDPISYIRRCYLNLDLGSDVRSKYAYLRTDIFDLYKIVKNENTNKYELTTYDTYLFERSGASWQHSGAVVLDDYLMPMKLPKDVCFEYVGDILPQYWEPVLFESSYDIWLSQKPQINYGSQIECTSIVNGMNFCWRQYSWRTVIPYVVEPQYDPLGYLRGSNIENISEYKGLKMYYKFPEEIETDDLVIFSTMFSNLPSNVSFDKDSCNIELDTTWEDSNSKRETYISASKVYGISTGNIINNINNVSNVTNITNIKSDPSPNVAQVLPFCEVSFLTSFVFGFSDGDEDGEMQQIREIVNDPTLSSQNIDPDNRYRDASNVEITIPLKKHTDDYCFVMGFVKDFGGPLELTGKTTYTTQDTTHITLTRSPIYPETVSIVTPDGTYHDIDTETTILGNDIGKILDSNQTEVGEIHYNNGEIIFNNPTTVTEVSYSKAVYFETSPINFNLTYGKDDKGYSQAIVDVSTKLIRKQFEHKVLIQDDGMATPEAVNIDIPYKPSFGNRYFTVMLLTVNAKTLESYGVKLGLDGVNNKSVVPENNE